VLAGKNW